MAVVLICAGCDQITKSIATENLATAPTRSYLGDFFRLTYAENTGAFLSLGSNLSKTARTILFTFMSGGLLVGLTIFIVVSKEMTAGLAISLSLILGGGASNLADRMLNDGRVVDFMNLGIGKLRTGIFNVADVAIMVGMGLVLLLNYQMQKKKKASENGENIETAVSEKPNEK
jgi:signal peptidase II